MASIAYESAAQMAEYLIARSTSLATGAGESLCLYDRPRHRYFVGALATAADMSRPGQEFLSRLSPSALGMEVSVELQGPEATVDVHPRCAVYYRVWPTLAQQLGILGGVDAQPDPALQDQELVMAFRRMVVDPGPIRLDLHPVAGRVMLTQADAVAAHFQRAFLAVIDQIQSDPDRYRGPVPTRGRDLVIPGASLADEETFRAYLASQPDAAPLPHWEAEVTVEARPANGNNLRLKVLLQNRVETTDEDRTDRICDHYLFDCHLGLEAEQARFLPFEFHTLPNEYRYDRRLWGYGQNCVVTRPEGQSDTAIQRLQSCTVPIYRQERYVTAERVSAPFADLATNPVPVLREIESSMVAYREDWEVAIRKQAGAGENPETTAARQADLTGFVDEIRRFGEGVDALERHPVLLQAFQLMNETFRRSAKGYDAWRLFQIVFIVMLIPDVASREPSLQATYVPERLAVVDVLWFPTGGGKTETYLGIVVFTAFFDRLRGKKVGVTAWTRFPLRLLSLQQLQRIADVMAAAELVRRNLPSEGKGEGFSVGYLVGEGNTPNDLKTYNRDLVPDLEADEVLRNRFRIINRCPFCGQKSVRMAVDPQLTRLNHECTNPDCAETVLPIHVVDNEIYRYLPTMIVGTVDKLAVIGSQRKISLLFGGVTHRCPDHGFGSAGECTQKYGCSRSVRLEPVKLYDPAPTLQIQDELHLLREGLGTFNAHYETWVDEFQQERAGSRMKIIAATATIENYQHQVRHLYLRNQTRRFPLPGRSLGESFYAETRAKVYRRIYVGVMPYNKTHINAVIDLLHHFHEEVQRLRKLSPLAGQARVGLAGLSPEEWGALLDNYDVSLTYVSALKEGDRLNQSVESQLSENLASMGLERLRNEELTGSTSFADVARILEELEKPPVDVRQRINAVTASSMISHGVDVGRLNWMLFFGMPRQTAEYIQSSSRVGRSHVGVVFVCFNPNRARDQSHYHFFTKYHEYLDRLVEPVPINRWSRFSLRRTFPGLVAGYWLSRVYPDHYRQVRPHAYDAGAVRKAIINGQLTKQALTAFLGRVYGVTESEGQEFGRELIERVDDAFNALLNPRTELFSGNLTPSPMRSLRDVDEPLEISPISEHIDLLRFLRNR